MDDLILCACGEPATQKAKTVTVLLKDRGCYRVGDEFNKTPGPGLCDGCARDYVHGRKRG